MCCGFSSEREGRGGGVLFFFLVNFFLPPGRERGVIEKKDK